MENKLSLVDVADLLSQRMGCTKKVAEQFLKELFSEASSVISSGESLKISGLGTFKPIWVAPRNSVNVRTGELFEIPGHYKLSFTPDKKMKDAVNAPFADFETVILSDNVDLSAIDKITAEKEIQKDVETIADNEVENEIDTVQKTAIDLVEKPEKYTDEKNTTTSQEKNDEQTISDKKNKNQEDIQENDFSQIKKSYRWIDITRAIKDIIVICLMLIVVAGVSYVVYKIYQDRQNLKQRKIASVEKKQILTVEKDSTEFIPTDTIPSKKNQPIAIEKISEGVTLAKLSLKHYGNKAFWVYIYMENKDKITNPDKIPIGMEVSIPNKENYNIDAENQQWINEAKILADKILGKIEK